MTTTLNLVLQVATVQASVTVNDRTVLIDNAAAGFAAGERPQFPERGRIFSRGVFGRYQWSTFYSGLTAEPVKGENVVSNHDFENFGATWTHIFSPTVVGEARVGYGRQQINISFLDPGDVPPIVRWSVSGFSNIMGNASS